ncbi:MAG: MFS transporter, partial [Firmicutes bacterium]|nr:MFS transporter [Bacillota bacterium]
QYFMYAILQVPVGIASRWIKPQKLLAAGALIDGIGTGIFGLSHQFSIVVASRLIVGTGDALVWLNIVLVISQWFGPKVFGRVLGLTAMGGTLGALFATYPLAVWIHLSGWRLPFEIMSVLLIVLALWTIWLLNRHHAPHDVQPAPAQPLAVQWKTLWHHPRSILSPMMTHFGFMGPYIGFVSVFAVPYLEKAYHVTLIHASIYLTVSLIGALVASPLMGRLSDTWGPRKPYQFAAAVTILAWILLMASPSGWPKIVLAVLFFGIGFGNGASVLTFTVVRQHFHREDVGLASGVANSTGFLSAVLTPLGMGIILTLLSHAPMDIAYRSALALLALFSLVGCVGTLLIDPSAKTA